MKKNRSGQIVYLITKHKYFLIKLLPCVHMYSHMYMFTCVLNLLFTLENFYLVQENVIKYFMIKKKKHAYAHTHKCH